MILFVQEPKAAYLRCENSPSDHAADRFCVQRAGT